MPLALLKNRFVKANQSRVNPDPASFSSNYRIASNAKQLLN
jgi:hypothetical protein